MKLPNISRYKKKEKSKITNQRQEVVKMFVDRLNIEREKTGFKKIGASYVAVRMSSMDIGQLRAFYGYCDESQNFAKTWWWKTNPKNYE